MRPRRALRQFHVAALEVEAIVLDIVDGGLPDDPHREHKTRPVAQMLGARRLHLVDGVPVSDSVEIFDRITLARDLILRVKDVPRVLGRGGRRELFLYLACLPGTLASGEKAMFCYPLEAPRLSTETLEALEKYLEESKKAKYKIVSAVEELEDVAESQGLPRKIVSTPPDPISYSNLTPMARSNLPDAVKLLLKEREDFFVEFFRVAGPINVRLHSIETLRGVGKRTLRRFLQERDTGALKLSSYEDVKKALKIDPVEALAEKILSELECDDSVKHYLFVEPCDPTKPFLAYLDKMWKSYLSRVKAGKSGEDKGREAGSGGPKGRRGLNLQGS